MKPVTYKTETIGAGFGPEEYGSTPISTKLDAAKPFIEKAKELNKTLVAWNQHNPYLLEGSMTMRGTNTAYIGSYVTDVDGGNDYYIESVTHSFTWYVSYTTSLGLSRGQYTKGGLYAKGLRGTFYFDNMSGGPMEDKSA